MAIKNVMRAIKYFLSNRRATFYAILMCIIGTACGIVTPILNKYLQEHIIPNKDLSMFYLSTIIIMVVNIASLLSSYFNSKIFIKSGVDITTRLRHEIISKNIFNTKHANNVGDVVICCTGFMEETNQLFITYISLIFDAMLKFIFYLPFFLFYGKSIALVMIAFMLIAIICVELQAIIVRRTAAKSRQVDSERIDFTLKMYEATQNPNFKDNEEISFETYKRKVLACDKAWLNYSVASDFYPLIFNLIWYIGLGVCILMAYELSALGYMTLAVFIVFNSYVDQLKAPLENFITFKQMSDRMGVALGRIYNYTDE